MEFDPSRWYNHGVPKRRVLKDAAQNPRRIQHTEQQILNLGREHPIVFKVH